MKHCSIPFAVFIAAVTGAEYFDAFINVKDISALIVRVRGK
jgi:hypothetical protein